MGELTSLSEALENYQPPTQSRKISAGDKILQVEDLQRSLNVSSLNNTFENFLARAGAAEALKTVRALADGTANYDMVLLYGGVGNGKTHLCEATAIYIYENEKKLLRVRTFSEVINILKAKMQRDEPGVSYDQFLQMLCMTGRLIVDDIGMGGTDRQYGFEILEQIVVARYQRQLWTLMVSNKDISELPERVSDRFADSQISRMVLVEAGSYRGMK